MREDTELLVTRRRILQLLAAAGLTGPAALELAAQSSALSAEILKNASAVIGGVRLSDERLAAIEPALQRNLDQFQIVRNLVIEDHVEPAPIFVPTRYTR